MPIKKNVSKKVTNQLSKKADAFVCYLMFTMRFLLLSILLICCFKLLNAQEAKDTIVSDFSFLEQWWNSWWLKAAVAVCFFGGILSYYAFRIKLIKHQNETLETLVNERTKELKNANSKLERSNNKIVTQNTLLKEKQNEIHNQHEQLRAINSLLIDHQNILTKKNDELQALIDTKDKMLSIIAHDLKNPMNTLIGFSDLLSVNAEKYDTEKTKKFSMLIKDASTNSYKLLDNLLTWARTQTGAISITMKQQSVDAIIEDCLHVQRNTATQKDILLQYNKNLNHGLSAYIDYQTISTAIRNIISNALKFTPRGGMVLVESDIIENKACISIIDTGVGMTDSQKSSLFSIKRNNSTKGTDNEKGTGLGLIICKEFVEKNKGTILFESEHGKGTTFQIYLPLNRKDSLRTRKRRDIEYTE